MFAYADLYESTQGGPKSGVEDARIVGINPLFNDKIMVQNK